MTTGQVIRIACASNAAYFPHAATMLTSLFHSNEQEKFEIHIMCDEDVTSVDWSALQNMVQKHGHTIYRISSPELPAQLRLSARFGAAAWFRVLLPDLIQDCERILYLDVDLIITGGIHDLWNTRLDSNLIATVTNPLYPGMDESPIHELGIKELFEYFNSGVILMNLSKLREFGASEKILAAAVDNPHWTRFADQDPLNAILHDLSERLDPKWNAQSPFFEVRQNFLRRFGFSINEISTARTTPIVVHFSGPTKPWQYACAHPYQKQYLHYRNQTAWPLTQFGDRSIINFIRRLIPVPLWLRADMIKRRVYRTVKMARTVAGKK